MSSTNQTPNLDLSQFIATDKPAWLVDYNGDMSKIDTGYGTVKAQADATDTAVTGVANRVGVVETSLTETINPAISALQTDDTAHGNAINTIQSLIGNGTPTTTDQTLIGAINEINAEVTRKEIAVTGDGVKTYEAILNIIYNQVEALNLTTEQLLESYMLVGTRKFTLSTPGHYSNTSVDGATRSLIITMTLASSGSTYIDAVDNGSTTAFTDRSSTAVSSSTTIKFVYR